MYGVLNNGKKRKKKILLIRGVITMTPEMLAAIIAVMGGKDNVSRMIFADNKDFTFGAEGKTVLSLDDANATAYVVQNRVKATNDMGMRGLNLFAFPYLQIISVIFSNGISVNGLDEAIELLKTKITLSEKDIRNLKGLE